MKDFSGSPNLGLECTSKFFFTAKGSWILAARHNQGPVWHMIHLKVVQDGGQVSRGAKWLVQESNRKSKRKT